MTNALRLIDEGRNRMDRWLGSLEGGADGRGRRAGLVCIDLKQAPSPVPDAKGRLGEEAWNEWLRHACPGEELRFGDELDGHLWVFAAAPPGAGDAETGEYLNAVARRLRRAIGCASQEADPVLTAKRSGCCGFGVARLDSQPGRSAKDSLYAGVLAALNDMLGGRGGRADEPADELKREMERLLRDRDLRSVYQPICKLATGEVFGYEALSRCPAGCRFEGPLELFTYAEKEGYSFALDRLAREKAIRGCPPLNAAQKIFINVPMGIMNDPAFVSGQTASWLREKGLRPGQVVLELTERSSIDDFEEAKRILRHYRAQGYEIAIDDAGAGYSSLQSIVELSPDYIKVDKSLVRNADGDEMKKQMLHTFVRFAKRMNIKTVAEGIERPEELRLLRRMGIDFGQGYLLGRPAEYRADAALGGLPNG